jgi:hypothetical protein
LRHAELLDQGFFNVGKGRLFGIAVAVGANAWA